MLAAKVISWGTWKAQRLKQAATVGQRKINSWSKSSVKLFKIRSGKRANQKYKFVERIKHYDKLKR